jgi:threonine/homoserine/homoserine lactone efflux protein
MNTVNVTAAQRDNRENSISSQERSKMKILINGFLAGLFLQLAIGPVFFFVLSIAAESDLIVALAGVMGVMLADYIYITLSIFGIAKLIDHPKVKKTFAIISALVIIAFGGYLLWNALQGAGGTAASGERTMSGAFATCFFLTISSPLTLFFWSSVFAVKAIEKNYGKKDITIFGIGAGLSTLIFMGAVVTVISTLNTSLPESLVDFLNIAVAVLMIGYGIFRIFKVYGKKPAEEVEE